MQDFRFIARALGKRPLYALATIVVFALAIGANSTVFSVLNGLVLRPLPYPDDDRLVMVYSAYPKMGLEDAGTSIPDFLDRRAQAAALESLAMIMPGSRTLEGEGAPERISVASATPSLFDVLGIGPALGRPFDDRDAAPGNDRVVLLSHRMWRTRFGGAAEAIGSEIRLNGATHRVIGVMPEGFNFFDRQVDAWLPLAITAAQASEQQRGQSVGIAVGRLRDGATVEGLNAELDTIVRRYAAIAPPEMSAFMEATGFTGRAVALRDYKIGRLDETVLMLQGIVLAVLLIACANVANLQIARTAARRHELSVRTALGADRWRAIRLVLIESLMLAALGGIAGVAVAAGGLELVGALGLDRSTEGFEFALDLNVLGFTGGAAIAAAFLSSLVPMLAFARADVSRGLVENGRQRGALTASRFRGFLVVVQLAASLALLTGAGLLAQSFYELLDAGPGFDPDDVLTASVAIPETRYPTPESRTLLYERMLETLTALPGVTDAGLTSRLPFSGQNAGATVAVDGYTPPSGGSPPVAQLRSISPGYLAALDVPVTAGRPFAATETERVAIVDEVMARKYWPSGDALGQRVGNPMDPAARWYTVVGIVPFVKHESLTEGGDYPTIYYHYTQAPPDVGVLTVRTSLAPELIGEAMRAAIMRLDPGIAVYDTMPMDVRIRQTLGPERTPMVLILVFAGLALTLAVVGIYGVLTSSVAQRVAEIGVRMALGARGADVMRLVLAQGARMIGIGLVLGAGAAILLGRVLSARIEYVDGLGAGVLIVAASGLATAALFASWLPARRASRIDPMQALRD